MTEKMTITIFDDEGYEVEIPGRYEVCGYCDGKGTHVNRSIDGHGISPEEFREDPDFEEAYFAGDYDVPCDVCGGKRVVLVPDADRCTKEQLECYWEGLRSNAECDEIQAAERRFGA